MTLFTGTLPTITAGAKTPATSFQSLSNALAALNDTWTTYTPAWTASTTNPAIGNGTITGRYQRVGKTVSFWAYINCGSTTTYGSGNYRLTIPVAPAWTHIGGLSGFFLRSTTSYPLGAAVQSSGAVTRLWFGSGAAEWSPTVPATLAAGDFVVIGGTYEAA